MCTTAEKQNNKKQERRCRIMVEAKHLVRISAAEAVPGAIDIY